MGAPLIFGLEILKDLGASIVLDGALDGASKSFGAKPLVKVPSSNVAKKSFERVKE